MYVEAKCMPPVFSSSRGEISQKSDELCGWPSIEAEKRNDQQSY